MAIVASASVEGYFEEIVEDAIRARKLSPSEPARAYVVALLADLAKPGNPVEKTLERPLTLLLDEALHAESLGDRFEKLRVLGDGVLYSSGFFADHFEARGVDSKYVIGIGKTAYETAGSLIRSGSSSRTVNEQATQIDIFHELAASFATFVDVIADVANTTVAHGVATSKGLVRLYERWLKTKSGVLESALTSHGFVTPRGGGSVLS